MPVFPLVQVGWGLMWCATRKKWNENTMVKMQVGVETPDAGVLHPVTEQGRANYSAHPIIHSLKMPSAPPLLVPTLLFSHSSSSAKGPLYAPCSTGMFTWSPGQSR